MLIPSHWIRANGSDLSTPRIKAEPRHSHHSLLGHYGRRFLNSLPLHSPQWQPWRSLSPTHARTEVARGSIEGLLFSAPNLSLSLLLVGSELDLDVRRELVVVRRATRARGEDADDQSTVTGGAA
jgi:hypothetical protein